MATTLDIRAGLGRLISWLDAHPDLPILCISDCEAEYAEIRLDADGHPALDAAADLAAALSEVQITVTDTPQHPPVADLVVSGFADSTDEDSRLEIGAAVEVVYETRTDLLARLGDPDNRKSREWLVTADVLRQVADSDRDAATKAAP
jgi:hypothetical protein